MFSHKAALVHIGSHAYDTPLAGVLPNGVVAAVGKEGLLLAIHGNHQVIIIEHTLQVLVIEVAEGVNQRLLMMPAKKRKRLR